MDDARTVEADAYADVVVAQEARPFRRDARTVGLDAVSNDLAVAAKEALKQQRLFVERDREGRRLSSVPDEVDDPMARLAQSPCDDTRQDVERHALVLPASPVVTIRAAKVAETSAFQDQSDEVRRCTPTLGSPFVGQQPINDVAFAVC